MVIKINSNQLNQKNLDLSNDYMKQYTKVKRHQKKPHAVKTITTVNLQHKLHNFIFSTLYITLKSENVRIGCKNLRKKKKKKVDKYKDKERW